VPPLSEREKDFIARARLWRESILQTEDEFFPRLIALLVTIREDTNDDPITGVIEVDAKTFAALERGDEKAQPPPPGTPHRGG
jgi:hypothetical protein